MVTGREIPMTRQSWYRVPHTQGPAGSATGRRSLRGVLALAVAIGGLSFVVNGLTPSLAGATNAWSSPSTIDGTNHIDSISCPTTSYCGAVDASGNGVAYNTGTWLQEY